MAAKKIPALRISSRPPEFRRAGRLWTREPLTVLLSELSKDQVKALDDEPLIVVERVDVEVGELAEGSEK